MAIRMIFEPAKQISDGVWSVEAPPHELQLLGSTKTTSGLRSVVLADGVDFDKERRRLEFDASRLSVLNIGTTRATIVVSTGGEEATPKQVAARPQPTVPGSETLGPGDQDFTRLVERELRGEAQEAATRLLREVRARWPGDLKRGLRLNFSNTPDNFWYVIVKPRVQALSITVRGTPDRFEPSTLDLKDDRPGYTRFELKATSELLEALRIIASSKRK